ncbi:MAG: radical SAM protein [Acidilobus sp.]
MECLKGVRPGPVVFGRRVLHLSRPFPMMGHIAFGVIERGTNVVQVRPSTLCFHDCIFCSVDAGPSSRTRRSEYLVDDIDWLVEWVKEVVEVKGGDVEALIDGVGEPLSNPRIIELVRKLKSVKGVVRVALETHGGSLSLPLVKALERAGLDRVNLSLDAMDPELARRLVNVNWYSVERLLNVVEKALVETRIDFVLTPVVVPGQNENEMVKLIEWAKAHRLGERSGWPSGVLIQKYEAHRFGRKPKGVKPWSWERFYSYLRRLERDTGYRLLLRPEEIGIHRAPRVERPYRVGDKVKLVSAGPGWLMNELLSVDAQCLRAITIVDVKHDLGLGAIIRGTIIRDEDNVYLARPT